MKVNKTYIYIEGVDGLTNCDMKISIEHGDIGASRVEISTHCKNHHERESQLLEVPINVFEEILHGREGLIDKLICTIRNYKNYGN